MKGKEAFSKFINAKPSNASVKEKLRQEKKAVVKARREAIEKHFEDKRVAKQNGNNPATNPAPKPATPHKKPKQ